MSFVLHAFVVGPLLLAALAGSVAWVRRRSPG